MFEKFKLKAAVFFWQLVPLRLVFKHYIKAGAVFGDAVSYSYMGECIGFADLLAKWAKWEKEFARRGYRTVTLDDFINLGGYGIKLKDFPARRRVGEAPVLYAEFYRRHYLGKVEQILDLSKDEPQVGERSLPSTKRLK